MKKRTMKKWIPNNTSYCYTFDKNGKINICKWWSKRDDKPAQDNGYCKYLKEGDWQDKNASLLWDKCKECGEKDNFEKIKRNFKKKKQME